LIDLVTMKEWVWTGDDLGAGWEQREIRAELKDLADEWRANLIEIAVEMDDEAMENYLMDAQSLTLTRCGSDPQRYVGNQVHPRFCVVPPLKNKGVQPLLNAVVDYLPSPMDVV